MKNNLLKNTILILSCVILTALGFTILNADSTTTIGLDINTGDITSTGTITGQDLTIQKSDDTTLTIYSNTDDPTDNDKLLIIQKGTTPSELFSVDEDGDVIIANDLSINNDLAITGNVTSGTWQGTAVTTQYGGTGLDWSTVAQGNLPYFSAEGTLNTLAPGTNGQFLKSQGTSADPAWTNVTRSATFVVAANDSSTLSKQQADYVCDGVDDQVEIQAAIDMLPSGGGKVVLMEGLYNLRAGISLGSNNTLSGVGASTILKAVAETKSVLTANASSGQNYVVVSDASGFEVGMECVIRDDNNLGWHSCFFKIISIVGNTITFNKNTNYDYTTTQNALLVNAFPIVYAKSKDAVVIEDLKIDGNNDNVGCYAMNQAGVFFKNVTNSFVRDIWIIDSNGDGISDQGIGVESYNKIIDNKILNAATRGVHIGSTISYETITGNNIKGTGSSVSSVQTYNPDADGIYFCMAVQHSVFSNNIIEGNFGNGIGGLGDNAGPTGDKYNVIEGNIITKNYKHGIVLGAGGDNSIIGNTITDNSQGSAGSYYGIGVWNEQPILISNNRIYDTQDATTQKYGIYVLYASQQGVGPHRDSVHIIGNQMKGHNLTGGAGIWVNLYAADTGGIAIENNDCTENKYGIFIHGKAQNIIVSGNVVSFNDRDGIYCDYGALKNIIITGNLCRNNGQESAGIYNGIYATGIIKSIFSTNRCLDDQTSKTQKYGLHIAGGSNYNVITSNILMNNNETNGLSYVGADNEVANNIVQ